ncbi:glycosyltransferase family A protein [Olsenella sp. HMSC062G07]|uniref:glycosyltransferase family 2 protein n=1 Tax=Olsenella sp. HMSC062G07 TaxID=1739330 RepID=UPI0008A2A7A2|nr:glycosyltransferase family A protein [Olsenella sp. HMSC062G07]OFK24122.1 hypothetical protein HMPREF2826_08330 [Olsenella sp. HMSC062G07]
MAHDAPPKLSIVVPCYKTERYLRRCLDSLLAQTLDGIEVIGVNDGSPDGCLAVLRDYERRRPDVIRVVDKANGGLWAARWSGTEVARGTYVTYVDSDDFVEPTFAESLHATALREGADVVVCGFRRVAEEDGRVLSVEMADPLPPFLARHEPGRLVGINPAAWNKCFSAELLRRMGRLEEPPAILEDVMLSQLAYLASRRPVAFTGDAPYNYLIRRGSMINSVTPAQVQSVRVALLEVRELFERGGASEGLLASLDATAFLHLGVSMSFRLSCGDGRTLREGLRVTTGYLDEHFPTWRRSPYMSLHAALTQGSAARKLWLARLFYKAGLMGPFLTAYRLLLRLSGRDLKW